MQTTSKALFGGALLAAGVSANAQTFMFEDTGAYNGNPFTSFSYVYASDGFGFNQNATATAPDDLNLSVTAYGTTATVSRTPNSFGVSAIWDGTPTSLGNYGFGAAVIQQFFEVTEPLEVVVTWDLRDTDFFGNVIFLIDNGANTIDVSIDAATPTGSLSFDVLPGVDYGLQLDLGLPFLFAADQTAFINAELIPTPGAAGVLGLAGLAAVRRRRR